MTPRHQKTWLGWLNHLSPLSGVISNVPQSDRELMSLALSMAAPQGPVGIDCVDECDCGRLGERQMEWEAGFKRAIEMMGAELKRIRARAA